MLVTIASCVSEVANTSKYGSTRAICIQAHETQPQRAPLGPTDRAWCATTRKAGASVGTVGQHWDATPASGLPHPNLFPVESPCNLQASLLMMLNEQRPHRRPASSWRQRREQSGRTRTNSNQLDTTQCPRSLEAPHWLLRKVALSSRVCGATSHTGSVPSASHQVLVCI